MPDLTFAVARDAFKFVQVTLFAHAVRLSQTALVASNAHGLYLHM